MLTTEQGPLYQPQELLSCWHPAEMFPRQSLVPHQPTCSTSLITAAVAAPPSASAARREKQEAQAAAAAAEAQLVKEVSAAQAALAAARRQARADVDKAESRADSKTREYVDKFREQMGQELIQSSK